MPIKLIRGLNWLTIATLTLIYLLASFMPIHFLADRYWLPSGVILLGSALTWLIITRLNPWLRTLSQQTYRWLLLGSLALLVVIQVLVALNFVDFGRADAFFVRNQAVALVQGSHTWNQYFQVYTNNVNLALFEAGLIRIGTWLGNLTPWIWLNLIQFAWLDCGLLAGLSVLKHRQNSGQASLFFTWAWLLAVPFYAYGLFSYSDVWVLPLPLMVLALWQIAVRHAGWQRWLAMTVSALLVTFGVLIKGNLIILAIALVGTILLATWRRKLTKHLAVIWLGLLAIVLLAGNAGTHRLAGQFGYRENSNATLPATSWVAMSLNPQTFGQYNLADASQQMSLPTKTAKQQSEQALIKQRLRKMGVSGLLVHVGKKAQLLTATGDMDSFRLSTQWAKQPQWYRQHAAAVDFWLANGMQILYLTALLGAGLFLRRQRPEKSDSLLTLFFLGLVAFHVLFWESEERYALPLLPIILFWGSLGWAEAKPLTLTLRHRRQLSWLSLPILGFVLWSALGVARTRLAQSQIVTEQGAGHYFQTRQTAIAPAKKLTTTMQVTGVSNELDLLPTESQGPVQVTLTKDRHVLLRKKLTMRQTRDLTYWPQSAGRYQLQIKNLSHRSVHFGAVEANYPVASAAVNGKPKTYLRYYVVRHYSARTTPVLTSNRSVWLLTGLAFLTTMAVLWWPKAKRVVRAPIARARH